MNDRDFRQLAHWAEIIADNLETYKTYRQEAEISRWSNGYLNSVVRCFPSLKEHLREVLQKTLDELDKVELKPVKMREDSNGEKPR